jgi:hypothetical protein
VHLVAVVEPVRAVRQVGLLQLRLRGQGLRQVLGQPVRDIDAEPGDPPVGPEPQRGEEVGPDLRVVPVQVRLLGREHVQVPLPAADRLPRRPAERRDPVTRRELAVGALAPAEDVAVALRRTGRRGQRLPEPDVPVRRVVGDDVDDQPDAGGVERGHELVELREGADLGVHVAVVVDVVTAVGERGRVEGAQPHGVDAQLAQVVHAAGDPGQVADAVAVRVREAARVDLVDDRLPPPRRLVELGVGLGGGVRREQFRHRGALLLSRV